MGLCTVTLFVKPFENISERYLCFSLSPLIFISIESGLSRHMFHTTKKKDRTMNSSKEVERKKKEPKTKKKKLGRSGRGTMINRHLESSIVIYTSIHDWPRSKMLLDRVPEPLHAKGKKHLPHLLSCLV